MLPVDLLFGDLDDEQTRNESLLAAYIYNY